MYIIKVVSINLLAFPKIFGTSRCAHYELAPRRKQRHVEIFIHFNTLILHTPQPCTVLKILGTPQSEIQFSRNFSLISSKSIGHLSSDSKSCLGFEIDAGVELGHRVKSQCLYLIISTLRKIFVTH